MPELPEMTAYCQKIDDAFKGKTLTACTFDAKTKSNVPVEEIESAIGGRRVTEVDRDGKEVVLRFDNGDWLNMHLMLTGRFNVEPSGEPPPAARVASFEFDNDKTLHVRDRFKQAKLKLNPEPAVAPDALSPKM